MRKATNKVRLVMPRIDFLWWVYCCRPAKLLSRLNPYRHGRVNRNYQHTE